MRRLNAAAAAECRKIDCSTETNDAFSSDLHKKLNESVLELIGEVADSKTAETAPPEPSPPPVAGAELLDAPSMLTLPTAPPISAPSPPRTAGGASSSESEAGGGSAGGSRRFNLTSASAVGSGAASEARSAAVSSIAGLASKPLLGDSVMPMPRGRGRPRVVGGR